MTNKNFLNKLKKEVIPGINIFELILFSFSLFMGITLFILTFTIWVEDIKSDLNKLLSSIIVLIDIPVGVIAATFLAKKSKLSPILLTFDALLYGGANLLAKQWSLGFVNFVLIPILYLIAFFWIWPKQNLSDNKEIETRKFSIGTGLILLLLIFLFSTLFGVLITFFTKQNVSNEFDKWVVTLNIWFGSFSSALMLVAVIFSILRFREIWYLYFLSNTLKIILFSILISQGDLASIQLLLLSITYFVNSIFGILVWQDSKLIKQKKISNQDL